MKTDTDYKSKQVGHFFNILHALFAVTIFLVFYLLALCGLTLNDRCLLDAAYEALQMVVMNADLHENSVDMNWQLQVSRFALPLFAAFSIIALIFKIAGQQVCYLKHAVRPRKNVFLGAGRMACGIINSLDKDTSIVAIDINIYHSYALSIRERPKSILLQGNARDIRILKRLRLNKVDNIYVFTGDDNLDLDIASKVVSLISKKKHKGPRLIVDIEDKSLRRIAGHIPVFQKYRENGGGIIWFSAKSLAVRKMLIEYPPITISSQKFNEPVHIGVVGLGDFAKETVLQLIRHCVYLKEHPLLISIFDNDGSQFQEFVARHPVLDSTQNDPAYGGHSPIADIRFYHYDTSSTSPSVIRKSLEDRKDTPFSRIYVTGKTNFSCIDTSYRIKQCLLTLKENADLICCLPELKDDTIKIKHDDFNNQKIYNDIIFYQIMKDILGNKEQYPGEMADRIGMMIHAAYDVIFNNINSKVIPKTFEKDFIDKYNNLKDGEWIKLNDFQQWSSRHSGDHIFVKLREIGFSLEPRSNTSTLPESEVTIVELEKAIKENLESLKINEHKRFCMERLVDDWLYNRKNDKAMQINKTIVKFEDLDKQEHAKDVAIIKALPLIVKMYIDTNQFKLVRHQ